MARSTSYVSSLVSQIVTWLSWMSREVLQMQLRERQIRAGRLLKRSRYLREWRQRWVVLTYNYLIALKSETSREITMVIDLRHSRSLKSYLSTQEDMMPGCFKLYTAGEGDYCFCAKDTFEKWSWMVAIERLMNYHTNLSTNAVSPNKYITEHGFPSLKEYAGADKHIRENDHRQTPSHEAFVMMTRLLRQHEQIRIEKEELIQQKHEFEALSDKCRLLEMNAQVQQQRIQQMESEALLAARLSRRTSSIASTSSLSFRESRKIREKASSSTRHILVDAIMSECGEESRVRAVQKWLVLVLVELTDQSIFGYRPIFQRAIEVHSNRFSFVDRLVELLEEGDLQIGDASSMKVLMFVKRIVMSYPSMLSYRQLNAVAGWVVKLAKKGHTQIRVKEILQMAVCIRQIVPSTMAHWAQMVNELGNDCAESESLQQMLRQLSPN